MPRTVPKCVDGADSDTCDVTKVTDHLAGARQQHGGEFVSIGRLRQFVQFDRFRIARKLPETEAGRQTGLTDVVSCVRECSGGSA